MATNIYAIQLTAAAPTAAQSLVAVLPTDGYAKFKSCRLIADNSNAAAGVQIQICISRASDPFATGGLATANGLTRGDSFMGHAEMGAGQAAIVSEFEPESTLVDTAQLYSANGLAYLGLKAVGLESGKVAEVQIEVTLENVAATTATTGAYLGQLVRFQDA